jgi:hypothetical protein
LLLQKDFSALATDFPAFAHFFKNLHTKSKILARRESCVWGGKKRNLQAKSGNFSLRALCIHREIRTLDPTQKRLRPP